MSINKVKFTFTIIYNLFLKQLTLPDLNLYTKFKLLKDVRSLFIKKESNLELPDGSFVNVCFIMFYWVETKGLKDKSMIKVSKVYEGHRYKSNIHLCFEEH